MAKTTPAVVSAALAVAGASSSAASSDTASQGDAKSSPVEVAQALANSSSAAQRVAQQSEVALQAVVEGIEGTDRALRVVARPPTFRRAGFEFGPEPVTLRLADLTPAQIEAIETEPELVCTRVFIPEVPGGTDAQA